VPWPTNLGQTSVWTMTAVFAWQPRATTEAKLQQNLPRLVRQRLGCRPATGLSGPCAEWMVGPAAVVTSGLFTMCALNHRHLALRSKRIKGSEVQKKWPEQKQTDAFWAIKENWQFFKSMLKFVTNPVCPFAHRVWLTLQETGIEYATL
jgi:hypothetical protein